MARDGGRNGRVGNSNTARGDLANSHVDTSAGQPEGLLVAIPCFNEGLTIGSVVLKARKHASEVVVVDDGSTDDTSWVAEEAGATVLRHPRNRGYGAALRSCFEFAKESPADVLVILDGDGQHDPAAIPIVAKPVVEGQADISIGSRFLPGKGTNQVPGYRRFGIGVITKLTNLGTKNGAKVHDAQSGFRAYSRRAVEVLDPKEADMGASTEILWDAGRNGLRVQEVSIQVSYPRNGSTKGPIRHGLGVLGSMLVYIETKHALLTFGIAGLLLLFTGFGLGLYVVQSYYESQPHVLAVGLSILTLMFVLVGTLLMFSGLILHAVINANRRMR